MWPELKVWIGIPNLCIQNDVSFSALQFVEHILRSNWVISEKSLCGQYRIIIIDCYVGTWRVCNPNFSFLCVITLKMQGQMLEPYVTTKYGNIQKNVDVSGLLTWWWTWWYLTFSIIRLRNDAINTEVKIMKYNTFFNAIL